VNRLTEQELAELLLSYGVRPGHVSFLSTTLEVVADLMAERLAKQRPPRKCAVCGEALDGKFATARPGARYCDARCRQQAYRKRINPRLRQRKRNTRADRYASQLAHDMRAVSAFAGVLASRRDQMLAAALDDKADLKNGRVAVSESKDNAQV
jgi:hypothetical protein